MRKPLPRSFIPPPQPTASNETPVLNYRQEEIGPFRRWITRKWRYAREECGSYLKAIPLAVVLLLIALRWANRIILFLSYVVFGYDR